MIDINLYVFSDIQTVISLSSGNSTFTTKRGLFGKAVSAIFSCTKIINFFPFIEEEFEYFKSLNRTDYPLEDEEYKKLTNYNPYLLDRVQGETQVKVAERKIFKAVRDSISEITRSLDFAEWVILSLPLSIEMLFYAVNGITLDDYSHRMNYETSWVCAENITYICNEVEEEGKETFELALNFPTCIDLLYAILSAGKKKHRIHNSIIDGYEFEAVICSTIKTLDVVYSKKDEGVSHQSDLQTNSFSFKYCVTQNSNSPVKSLASDVLYHLRPCHPVIDAVACVMVDDKPWLLLIQVSLSAYKGHDSKFKDLKNQIKGCERTSLRKDCTWIDYYKQKVPANFKEGLQCMYIYISPKNFIEKDASSDYTYDLRKKKKDYVNNVYFGLIMKDSVTAAFIALKETEVTKLY